MRAALKAQRREQERLENPRGTTRWGGSPTASGTSLSDGASTGGSRGLAVDVSAHPRTFSFDDPHQDKRSLFPPDSFEGSLRAPTPSTAALSRRSSRSSFGSRASGVSSIASRRRSAAREAVAAKDHLRRLLSARSQRELEKVHKPGDRMGCVGVGIGRGCGFGGWSGHCSHRGALVACVHVCTRASASFE